MSSAPRMAAQAVLDREELRLLDALVPARRPLALTSCLPHRDGGRRDGGGTRRARRARVHREASVRDRRTSASGVVERLGLPRRLRRGRRAGARGARDRARGPRTAGRLEAETDVGARLPLGDPPGDVSHARRLRPAARSRRPEGDGKPCSCISRSAVIERGVAPGRRPARPSSTRARAPRSSATRPANARTRSRDGQDADQPAALGDERRADVVSLHALGHLAERVLGLDGQRSSVTITSSTVGATRRPALRSRGTLRERARARRRRARRPPRPHWAQRAARWSSDPIKLSEERGEPSADELRRAATTADRRSRRRPGRLRRRLRRNCGATPVRRSPRRTGRNGAGWSRKPASAAIDSAAASACCVAIPPCLTGKIVMSPAAYTSGIPGLARARRRR